MSTAPPTDDGAHPERVEAYEDDGRIVLFDADNPLAWVEASRAVPLPELT